MKVSSQMWDFLEPVAMQRLAGEWQPATVQELSSCSMGHYASSSLHPTGRFSCVWLLHPAWRQPFTSPRRLE